MTAAKPMRALVVHESMFGNTERIARAVTRGLEAGGWSVKMVGVADAPRTLTERFDLVVAGAPTHAFSLSRPSTRADAVRQGAPTERAAAGLREWIDSIQHTEPWPRLAVFDTRASKVRWLPRAAAQRAVQLARRRGFTLIDRPTSYLVQDIKGPLVVGEEERAETWGRSLAHEGLGATEMVHPVTGS